jgi:protein-S-isoprenylcysteine O-methyltransferase Ste14
VAAARVAEGDMGKQAAGPRDLLVVVLVTAVVFGVVYGLNESLHVHLHPFAVYCIVVLVTLTAVWISRRMKNKKFDA